ncbi:MAG: flagellar motor switch protein FliN [Bryobacteraceae bacterium]|nr:flagellar motor switch protein FliN [Bryobacteraceae bacterium]
MEAPARWMSSEWAQCLRQAVEAMTGESVEVEASPGGPGAGCLWWVQPVTAATGAALTVGAENAAWREIGGRTLRAAGIEQPDEADIESTYREVLSQALSGFALVLGHKLGREVTCGAGTTVVDAPPAGVLSLELRFPGGPALGLYVAPNPALLESLDARRDDSADRTAMATQEKPSSPSVATRNLDLLLEVELPVSVSFGRAQLRLKDAIKLTTGSIVELNRSILEPVEVIVNNCVIARGEVVVIEGYYGVRIQQIVSRQERLRTLT